MADIERTVDIIFSGRDDVSGTIQGVVGRWQQFDDAVQRVAAPLADIARGLIALDAAATTLAAGGLAVAVSQAGTFGDAFREISTLIDATGPELDGFRADILAYGRDSVFAFDQINNATYQAISLGIGYQDALEVVNASEQLAVAGKAELNRTVELLVGTLNAYGAGVDEATHYSDVFFTTVRDGKTTIPELAQGLSQVVGIAANAGVPIETLAAAIAALTAAGTPTAQAITGLRAAIANIINPSSQARDLANELGIEFNAQALEARGLEGVLRDVTTATGGNVGEMTRLFGSVEGLNAALILGRDASGTFARALGDMQDTTDATRDAYERMADAFGLANQRLVNNLQATLVQVGTPLLEQYGDLTQAISALFAGIGQGIDAGSFAPLFDYLTQAGGQVTDYLNQVAAALPDALSQVDWAPLLAALDRLGDGLGTIFRGLDLTSADGLADALNLVAGGLTSLVNVSAGVAQAIGPSLNLVGQAFAALLETFNRIPADYQVGIGRILGDSLVWHTVGTEVGAALTLIREGGFDLGSVFQQLPNVFSGVLGAVQATFLDLAGGAVSMASTVANAVSFMTFGFSDGIEDVRGRLAALSSQLDQQGQQAWADYAGAVIAGGGQISDALRDRIGPAYEEILARNLDVNDAMWDMGRSAQAAVPPLLAVDDAMWDMGRNAQTVVVGADDAARAQAGLAADTERSRLALGGFNVAAERTRDTLNQAGGASDDFRLKTAQLEADVATRKLELAVDLKTAQFDAEARVMIATFGALEQTAASTGDAITNLFAQYAQAVGSGNSALAAKITNQLLAEEQRREEAHRKAMDLTQAQIDAINVRNQLLLAGGGLIQIDSTGLEPALEAVMWNIIQKVQLRVNASAAELLLGI